MSIVPEEERFHKVMIGMADAIKDGIGRLNNAGYKTVDLGLVNLIVQIICSFDKHHLIRGFIENSHNLWDSIKQRDEAYFIDNASTIFGYLPMDKVNLFKDLFTTKDANGVGVISQSFKNDLWHFFDAMIKISIQYIHKGRAPCSQQTANGVVMSYGVSFFDHVDINKHAHTWKIIDKLDFPVKY
jgi:hypothetical protein